MDERAPTTRQSLAFRLSQRAPSVGSTTGLSVSRLAPLTYVLQNTEPVDIKVARAADHLSNKYSRLSPSGTVPGGHSNQEKRDNKFAIETAATPTATNAVGLAQGGSDLSYFIQMGFGSGSKPLWMLFDTGAGTSWVMGTGCQSPACTLHTSYGSADSKTFQQTSESFTITYGSGTVAGNVATDSISVAGIKAPMTFGVTNITSDDFTHFAFDGIIGMSLAPAVPQTDNFVLALKNQKLLPANVFAISLNRNVDGPNTGEVMFGATDPAQFTGKITYTSVATKSQGDWAIPMDGIMYDGTTSNIAGKLAYIDTGTSYIFGPADDVAALHKQIPGAQSADGVTYTVPCGSDKPLAVSFSGVTYNISAADWLSTTGNQQCRSNIYGRAVIDGSWLLGDVFLKNVYAVFDADQIQIGEFFACAPYL